MCGVIGYIGKKSAKEIIFNGLSRLEYRGYDSCGVAFKNQDVIHVFKDAVRVDELEKTVNETSYMGIGHNRWATHGIVSKENSHPHFTNNNEYVIVHNGIIENYLEIKDKYFKDDLFFSQTDSEVVCKLLKYFGDQMDMLDAIKEVMRVVKGSYAILLMRKSENRIYFMRNHSPLLLGIGIDEMYLSSDLMALNSTIKEYIPLNDLDYGYIDSENYFVNNLRADNYQITILKNDFNYSGIDKGVFPHYMLKEIFEQPAVIKRIIDYYKMDDAISFNIIDELNRADELYIIACGTSYYAGHVGMDAFERIGKKRCHVYVASEFTYNMPIIAHNAFFILISQSGETADLKMALEKIKAINGRSLILTNVLTSTLAKMSTYKLPILAGPEIAVASTKAYVAQICVLAILANKIALEKKDIFTDLYILANAISSALEKKELIEKLTLETFNKRNAFYIGRGLDYYVSLEAALKLKEISYVQTEGFSSGELKHGTIALIEQDTPVAAIISNKETCSLVRSNINEVVSRGAKTLVICTRSVSNNTDHIILEDVPLYLSPALLVVPTQLIAYFKAKSLGLDIDKPRNLAKSVTVE